MDVINEEIWRNNVMNHRLLKYFLFPKSCFDLHICTCLRNRILPWMQVPAEARRGPWTLWSWSSRQLWVAYVGAGNWGEGLWKSNKGSYLLSHSCRPSRNVLKRLQMRIKLPFISGLPSVDSSAAQKMLGVCEEQAPCVDFKSSV